MNLQWSHLVFNQLSLLKMKSKKIGQIWAFQTREAKFTSVHLTVLLTNKRKILNVLSFNSKNAPPKIFSPHCLQNQNQINDCRRDKTLKKKATAHLLWGPQQNLGSWFTLKLECEWFFLSVFFIFFVHSLNLDIQSWIKRPFCSTINLEISWKFSLFLTKQVRLKSPNSYFKCTESFIFVLFCWWKYQKNTLSEK